MFQKDDYVNYGSQGICHIEDIRFIRFDCRSGGRDYYILRPVHQDGSRCLSQRTIRSSPDGCGRCCRRRRLTRSSSESGAETSPGSATGSSAQLCFRTSWRGGTRRIFFCWPTVCIKNPRGERRSLSAADAAALKKAEEIVDREFAFSPRLAPQSVGAYIRRILGLEETFQGNGEGKSSHAERA